MLVNSLIFVIVTLARESMNFEEVASALGSRRHDIHVSVVIVVWVTFFGHHFKQKEHLGLVETNASVCEDSSGSNRRLCWNRAPSVLQLSSYNMYCATKSVRRQGNYDSLIS